MCTKGVPTVFLISKDSPVLALITHMFQGNDMDVGLAWSLLKRFVPFNP